jgi:hypothetical protein
MHLKFPTLIPNSRWFKAAIFAADCLNTVT